MDATKYDSASDSGLEVDPRVARLEDPDANTYFDTGFRTTYSASLTSSIEQYIYENGRRYHTYYGEEKNPMPTDEQEQERLDIHHEILSEILEGELYLAPVSNPRKVLDVGTGTGIWAIDMADLHPEAEVTGTDLSPIQPTWVPPNLRFEVDDAEKEWPWDEDYFDFVHFRNLAQSISDWDYMMSQCYRCTEPGGYVELAELGFELFSDDDTNGPAFEKFIKLLAEACEKIGRPIATEEILRERLAKVGFQDIQIKSFKQPFGPWPKDQRMKRIGAMVMMTAEGGTQAYGMALMTRTLGMSAEEASTLCREAAADVANKNYHSYTPYYVAWGRKPVATQQVKTSEEDNAMSEEELLGEDDLTGEGNE